MGLYREQTGVGKNLLHSSTGAYISQEARKASEYQERLNKIEKEITKGDFSEENEFEKLANNLREELEKAKLYDSKEIHWLIEELTELFSKYFTHHVLNQVGTEDLKTLGKEFNDYLKKLVQDLRNLKRDDRRLRRGRSPRGAILKRVFLTDRMADRQVKDDARKDAKLEKEVKDEIDWLKKELAQTVIARNAQTLVDHLKQLAEDIKEIIEVLYEIVVDIDIQETDLFKELKEIDKKSKNKSVTKHIEKIEADMKTFARKDRRTDRRLLKHAQKLQTIIEKGMRKSLTEPAPAAA